MGAFPGAAVPPVHIRDCDNCDSNDTMTVLLESASHGGTCNGTRVDTIFWCLLVIFWQLYDQSDDFRPFLAQCVVPILKSAHFQDGNPECCLCSVMQFLEV